MKEIDLLGLYSALATYKNMIIIIQTKSCKFNEKVICLIIFLGKDFHYVLGDGCFEI